MTVIIALVIAVDTQAAEASKAAQTIQGTWAKVTACKAELQLFQLGPGLGESFKHRRCQWQCDGGLLCWKLLLEWRPFVNNEGAQVCKPGQL
jgi:hypothetical protein